MAGQSSTLIDEDVMLPYSSRMAKTRMIIIPLPLEAIN